MNLPNENPKIRNIFRKMRNIFDFLKKIPENGDFSNFFENLIKFRLILKTPILVGKPRAFGIFEKPRANFLARVRINLVGKPRAHEKAASLLYIYIM